MSNFLVKNKKEISPTFPSFNRQIHVLEALIVDLRAGLISWIGILGQVGMSKCLLSIDALVRIQFQHLLNQVHSCQY